MFHRKFDSVPVIWKPEEKHGKVVKRFKKLVEDKYGVKLDGYPDLYKWSIDNLCEFWAELWDFWGVICSKRYETVVDLSIPMSESPKWFEGARLNLAENLLKFRDDRVALIQDSEDSEAESITYSDMYEEAKLYCAAFRKIGLKKGDIVCCYMSNRKEAILGMLGTNSVGGIWTGALPLMGAEAVLNRFKQVNPKVILTIDRFRFDGEEIEMLPKVKELAEGLPSVEKVIIVASRADSRSIDISGIRNSIFLDDFLKLGLEKDGFAPPIQFEQVSFSHPVIISYTSGTTGLPKAIVHGFGALLSVSNGFGINYDSARENHWLTLSPVGWASWTIHISLLFLGETVVLYEGCPYFLSPTSYWDLLEKHRVSHFFIPASALDELYKRKYFPTEKHDLSSLKFLLAGGSIVKPQTFDFMKSLKKDFLFASSYGCTEIMTVCLAMEMTLPQYKAEINAACLGTAVDVVDDAGNSVIGEVGEVVLRKPIPGLLLGLWGDEDGSACREKYYSKYPGAFALGDFGIRNPVTKNWIICCRSDETLKQRGCRFGSVEIYNIVEVFPEVRDSLCVSQYNKDLDERAVLFLKIRDGYSFSEELVTRIRDAIAKGLTVRHVPDVIIEAPDIPYNMNNKKMEVLVKKIINKLPYNHDTIINPDCLQYYRNVQELQEF